MRNIVEQFQQTYEPLNGLIVYGRKTEGSASCYVESFEIDSQTGQPINMHPLTEAEAKKLAGVLHRPDVKKQPKRRLMHSEGLLSERVLYLNTDNTETVVWYSPAQARKLFFVDDLGIPNGVANVPALIWKASQNNLLLYALASDERPTLRTRLFLAPFFNVSMGGSVCMGTVKRDIADDCSLDQFMRSWEDYFFNSYFSHTNATQLTKTNIVQLWQQQIGSKRAFPIKTLIESKTTLTALFA